MHIFIFVIVCISFAGSAFLAVFLKRNYTTAVALLCTVIADIFLLLLNTNYPAGLLFFSMAQLLYAERIFRNRRYNDELKGNGSNGDIKNKSTINALLLQVILRLGTAAAVMITVSVAHGGFDWVLILASFYGVNFLYNLLFALKNSKSDILLTVGLLLFAVCDIMVLTLNLPDYLDVSINQTLVFTIMYIFYIPSQLLIGLSTAEKRARTQLV